MYANNLNETSRIVSHKPNDCLQITFQNECAKRHMSNLTHNRRRSTDVSIPNYNVIIENDRPYKKCNSKDQKLTNFSCATNSFSKTSQISGELHKILHPLRKPYYQNCDSFQPGRDFTRPPNFSPGSVAQRRGSSLQQSRPPSYRAFCHNAITDTTVRSLGPRYGKNHSSSSVSRRLPLSHPSRFLEEPYRDVKLYPSVAARYTKRVPSPVDIHLPPPSAFKKYPIVHPYSTRCIDSRQQPYQKQWNNESIIQNESHKHSRFHGGVPRQQNTYLQHVSSTSGLDSSANGRPHDDWHVNHRGFGPRRGRGTSPARTSRNLRQQLNCQQNHHHDYHHLKSIRTQKIPGTRWKSGGFQQSRPQPPPFTDEYIDDFTLEDLAKYKLEIDMENFTVQSPIISDPILNIPLSNTWLTDDFYQNISQSPDRQQPPVSVTACVHCADCEGKNQVDVKISLDQESHKTNWNRRYPSGTRSFDGVDCNSTDHEGLFSSRRIGNSCPSVTADCLSDPMADVYRRSFQRSVSLPESVAACLPESCIFHSRSCSQLKALM